MAAAWQQHGSSMAAAWRQHGSSTAVGVNARGRERHFVVSHPLGHGGREPSEPGREELALEAQQRLHPRVLLRVGRRAGQHRVLWEGLLDGHDDVIRLADHLAVDLGDRDAATRLQRPEPRRLVSVAVHVHLLDRVRHALLLEREPHLLAVRAPGRRVAVERHARLLTVRQVEEPLLCEC